MNSKYSEPARLVYFLGCWIQTPISAWVFRMPQSTTGSWSKNQSSLVCTRIKYFPAWRQFWNSERVSLSSTNLIGWGQRLVVLAWAYFRKVNQSTRWMWRLSTTMFIVTRRRRATSTYSWADYKGSSKSNILEQCQMSTSILFDLILCLRLNPSKYSICWPTTISTSIFWQRLSISVSTGSTSLSGQSIVSPFLTLLEISKDIVTNHENKSSWQSWRRQCWRQIKLARSHKCKYFLLKQAITVAPEYRKQGVARFLMNYIEDVTAKLHNGWFVDLFVRPSNSVAVRMYRNFGYEVY